MNALKLIIPYKNEKNSEEFDSIATIAAVILHENNDNDRESRTGFSRSLDQRFAWPGKVKINFQMVQYKYKCPAFFYSILLKDLIGMFNKCITKTYV